MPFLSLTLLCTMSVTGTFSLSHTHCCALRQSLVPSLSLSLSLSHTVVHYISHWYLLSLSLSQLVYCLTHFTGDDKVPPYIHHLIDPSEVTERSADGTAVSLFSNFTEDDYLALRMKNPETLFQDETYMKHLRRHANK